MIRRAILTVQCAVHLRNAVEHLRRAAKTRATQRLRDDDRGTDNERTRRRRHDIERQLVDLADVISSVIDKWDA